MSDELQLAGHGGNIHVRVWAPEDPTAVVFIVHGYAEYGGRYAHVGEAFNHLGYAVVASDHVGHGLSEGERALITDFGLVVDDLGVVADYAAERFPELPQVMLGHSMGGLLTGRFVQRWPDRLAGAGFLGAVLGDWVWAREVLALPELPEADSDPSGMSRDPKVCADYASDPLVYHGLYKRPLLASEVVALDEFQAERERIAIPLAMFHGDADPFVPHGPAMVAVTTTSSLDIRIKVYPGARHELVNEINQYEVLDDIAHWIAGIL